MTIRPLNALSSNDCAALIGRKARMHALVQDGRDRSPDHRSVGTVLDADRHVCAETAWHGDIQISVTIDGPGNAQPLIFYAWTGAECLWGIEMINDAFDVPVPAGAELAEQGGTIWDRTGIAMVDRVVEFLYHRITHDEALWEIFRHVPVGAIKAKFRQWLIGKLGGESDYKGDMSKHNNWPITDWMFERVCNYALAGFMVEHVSREDLTTIESVALAERKNVVTVEG